MTWIFGTDPFASSLRCWCCGVRSHEVDGIWETRVLRRKKPEVPGPRVSAGTVTAPPQFVTEDPNEYIDLCPMCKGLSEPELEATARRLARERLGLAEEGEAEGEGDSRPGVGYAETD